MKTKITVFMLEHVHSINHDEDRKIIGVYSSRESAQQALERLSLQPGFSETPEGFTIDPYVLDEDGWCEGYITR